MATNTQTLERRRTSLHSHSQSLRGGGFQIHSQNDDRWCCMHAQVIHLIYPINKQGDTKCAFVMRLTSLLLGIIGLLLTRTLGLISDHNVDCMLDILHRQTSQINIYLHNNPQVTDALLIISNEAIDIFSIILLVGFLFYNSKHRLMITFFLFYILRSIIQILFVMREPDGYIWRNPGFPSLMVPTGKTTDFFYSGHVGYCLIATLEFHKLKWCFMKWFCFSAIILESFTMIVLRGHYTIDLIAGLIIAHWCFMIATYADQYLQRSLIPQARELFDYRCKKKANTCNQKKRRIPIIQRNSDDDDSSDYGGISMFIGQGQTSDQAKRILKGPKYDQDQMYQPLISDERGNQKE